MAVDPVYVKINNKEEEAEAVTLASLSGSIGREGTGLGVKKEVELETFPDNDLEANNSLKGSSSRKTKKRWLNKILDLKEAKIQIFFAVPISLTNVCQYLIPLISVMFAGHLGELQLAGATLANSWAIVTGWSFAVGSSGALETLCGQAHGAKLYRMLGMYLQASSVISFFFSIIISIIWWYSNRIFIFLHQDPQIAKAAGLYLKFLIPGLFAFSLLENIMRFLQTQSIVVPLVVCSVLPLLIHAVISYLLVYRTGLGFSGAALAVSISFWISVIMLCLYVRRMNRFKHTWEGFSKESFRFIPKILKLALPGAAMVCLEYFAFEILVFLAGLMPNPEVSTALIAMSVNTEATTYMIAYGLTAAASTRVANELGAGNPTQAKNAMVVTLKLGVVLAVATVLALAFGHNVWAGLFSNSPTIIKKYASITPLLIVAIVLDFSQGILSGVARGCGWQHLAMGVNFGAFYLIGIPIACLLALKFKLYAKGLWLGTICGLCCQVFGLMLLCVFSKWSKVEISQNRDEENSAFASNI